ncbi:hypothetical protein PR048_004921 [Dryococelus australis]|uniref:Reverse transcriptase Ty1/copia-type domain-containing protein n=1 Tax=Dryococelus australis TaxID=614101 RepID=A0ABQ9I7M9_9NEOP|nr:hypothetical protein PR048_004921 [Dryococelus australis]
MSEIRMLPHIIVIKSTNGGEMIATRGGKFMGDYGSGTINFEASIVPGLKNNLLSVSKVNQKNSTVVFGMIIEYHTPYTPQYNSKAEGMKLTLMNKVRTKSAETDQPRTFWGQLVRASAYELNRPPTSSPAKQDPNPSMEVDIVYGGPLKEKIVSSRDVTLNESKVGVGNDTARYQGINIDEDNEHLNRKDSTEAKTDTEENGTKEVTKHSTPQLSSKESDEEFIGFEDSDKENNKRSKPNRTFKKPSHLQEYELYMAYCLCAGEPQDYEDAIKLGNEWEEAIEISIKWEIRQLDVPTAFLNEYVDDDIYIKTPDGVKNEPGVLKLKRRLYGLRLAPKKWNERFHNFMGTHGMKRSVSDFFLYIGDKLDRKSVSGYVLLHGKNAISWASRKQGTVALSTAEAEYIACATAACDLVYFQGVLQDLQSATTTPVLLTDNQSAIDMAESCENSRHSDHIDIKFHYLKDLVDKKIIKINYVSS